LQQRLVELADDDGGRDGGGARDVGRHSPERSGHDHGRRDLDHRLPHHHDHERAHGACDDHDRRRWRIHHERAGRAV
jgi:hypothetical protein